MTGIARRRHADFLIESLMDADVYPHEVSDIRIHETHISWVILTGPFAYKIKKPVVFDFVDYSTLERRKAFCEKELELNRRFAPNLYLGVVPIFEFDSKLVVGDELGVQQSGGSQAEKRLLANQANSHPIEYAVKMRQFRQEAIAAAMIKDGELIASDVERLGLDIAKFHESIECASLRLASVTSEKILADAIDNFTLLNTAFENDSRHQTVQHLEKWSAGQFWCRQSLFSARLAAGKVRRCHGDMHLNNIVHWDGRLVPFDGIEFNEDFQWIDVCSEIAFPVMDFAARGRADFGWRLLNAYLEATGDYRGLSVLRFYLVYRAMVRAKVTWLNPKNRTAEVRRKYSTDPSHVDPLAGPWDKYLQAAVNFAFELKPSLSITHGFSGSGKSTVAMQEIARTGGVRIRSDVERQRLGGQLQTPNRYTPEMSDRVYELLLELARAVIEAGLPVVVDATFLNRGRRQDFARLANELQVEFRIIDCAAPFEELCQRIRNRGPDPSEATIEVLKMQMQTHQPLSREELGFVTPEP